MLEANVKRRADHLLSGVHDVAISAMRQNQANGRKAANIKIGPSRSFMTFRALNFMNWVAAWSIVITSHTEDLVSERKRAAD
jgi:hypothetical protein